MLESNSNVCIGLHGGYFQGDDGGSATQGLYIIRCIIHHTPSATISNVSTFPISIVMLYGIIIQIIYGL